MPDNASPPREPACFGPSLDARLLWPPLTLAALVLALAGSTTLGLPLKWVVPWAWASLPLIGLGLLWTAGGLRRGGLLVGGLALLSAWLVIMDITGHPDAAGMLSIHPDTWSYQALADFLYHYARTHPPRDIPLLDQYGGGLYNTRFGAPSLIAFLCHAPFLDAVEEVPFAHHAYCALCLAVHFFGFAYLMRALGCRWRVALPAGVLATAGGWLGNLILIGNYDNLLFLALAPAWLGVAASFLAGRLSGPRFAIAGAVCLAALFYVYPEGFMIFAVLNVPLFVSLAWGAVRDWRRALALAAFGALLLLLVAPYAPTFHSFVAMQYATGTQPTHAARPGTGNFPGLLAGARLLPAAFALGDEFPVSQPHLTHILLACGLVLLAIVGALALRKEHPWFPWVALCVAGLLIWQGVLARYDYGVYKVLGCSSWWIYSAAAAGAGSLLRRGGAAAIYAGFALLLTAIGAEKWEDRRFRVWNSFYSLEPVRELDGVDRVIGPAPILFEVTDDMDYMWASVYLRRHPLLTTKLHGYYIFTSVKMRGPALEDCHYRLVSGDQPEAVWHNARFSLLPIAVAKLDQIENPNGLETVGNQSFFWLSSRPTTITIYAPAAGEYELAASAFQAGASVAPGSQCPIEVEDPAGRRVFVPTLGQHAPGIPLHLDRGENRVTLRGLSRATILSQPNGDTRELLLGVLGPRLQSRVSAAPSPAP